MFNLTLWYFGNKYRTLNPRYSCYLTLYCPYIQASIQWDRWGRHFEIIVTWSNLGLLERSKYVGQREKPQLSSRTIPKAIGRAVAELSHSWFWSREMCVQSATRMSTAGIFPVYVTCWQGYTDSNSKVGSRESLRKYLSSIRATGVTWWIEIDLERELSAFARSLACSAGPVQPVAPSVGSLRSIVSSRPFQDARDRGNRQIQTKVTSNFCFRFCGCVGLYTF